MYLINKILGFFLSTKILTRASFSFAGNATPQQPIRPSFMDYFDKQDSNKAAQQQENYNHNQPPEQPGYHIQSKNVFPDNWKVPQDGDFDFVSATCLLMPFGFFSP